MKPSSEKAATKYRSLCSSKQVVQGQSQAVSDIGLCQNPSQEATEPTYPAANFRQHWSRIQLVSQEAHPKGDLGRHQTLPRWIPLRVVITCSTAHTVVRVSPHSQLAWGPIPHMNGPIEKKISYNKQAHRTHTKFRPSDEKDWCTGSHRIPSSIRPHHQDWESEKIYLIHRNKHKVAVKMVRQRNIPKQKNRRNLQKKS